MCLVITMRLGDSKPLHKFTLYDCLEFVKRSLRLEQAKTNWLGETS